MTQFACFLIVTEPMTDAELDHLAGTGETSGKDFVSVCIAADYEDAIDRNLIARRIIAADALEELGIEAFGFDEYGWKEL